MDGKQFIIAAEDDEFQSQILGMTLEGIGHEFKIAQDGVECVNHYKAKNGAVTLILMDLHMPNMDGLEAAKTIRALEKAKGYPKCKIWAVSADDDSKTKSNVTASGMDGLIKQPIDEGKIQAVL